jgi:digeranylgeranylglycerophospholipid reductase
LPARADGVPRKTPICKLAFRWPEAKWTTHAFGSTGFGEGSSERAGATVACLVDTRSAGATRLTAVSVCGGDVTFKLGQSLSVDVLVVGFGPAGAAAARAAARRGARVLAIDRKRQVGVPVRPGEFIPRTIASHAGGPGVITQSTETVRGEASTGVVDQAPRDAVIVDRAAVDRSLVAMAEQPGAELRLRSALQDLDVAGHLARVRSPEGLSVVHYRVLIAADGARSRVAALLGLPQQEMMHSRQYTVPLLVDQHDAALWLSGEYPGAYAWLFPNGGEANLGIGIAFDDAREAKNALDKLHGQLVEAGRVGAAIRRRTVGPIPASGMRPLVVFGRIAFAGHAAGLIHPMAGAGIAQAMISGDRAGEAAADSLIRGDAALDEYQDEMRERYAPTLETILRVRTHQELLGNSTADVEDDLRREPWLAVGTDDYLAKPFRRDALKLMLERWVLDRGAAPAADEVPAREAQPSTLDPSTLDQIRRNQRPGEASIVGGLLDDYFADAAQSIESLHRAAERSDTPALARTAHTLGSGSGFLGARKLARMCAELEKAARYGDTQDLVQRIARIQQEYEAVRNLADTYRSSER